MQLKIERFLINMQQLIIQKSSTLTFFSVHNCESSKSVFLFSSCLKPRMSSLQIIALSYASFPLSWCNENFDLLQSFHPITTRLCNPNYRAVEGWNFRLANKRTLFCKGEVPSFHPKYSCLCSIIYFVK